MSSSFSSTEQEEKTIKIREIFPSDISRLVEIEKASFTSPWTKEMLKVQINSPSAFNLAIESKNYVVGYIMCILASDECHVLNFAVDPKLRRRGFGSKLFSFALSKLKKRGIRSVYLEVRESNLPAINLYLKFGFKIVGKRKRYYEDSGEDALVMCLEL